MQSSNHKGIVEGSSANDFKQDESEIVEISTPFSAALVDADAFEAPEPTVVNIEERVAVSVQRAMDAGTYVDTRPAPVSLATQKLVRTCYLYLWQRRRDGGKQVLPEELGKHVGWDNEILWSQLRTTWGVSQLDGVLRDCDSQFVMTVLEENKVVGDCKIADHPNMRAVESNPRTSISVGLVEYVADPSAMANAMCQISGSHPTV